MEKSIVSSKYQVVIPKAFRQGIEPGSKVIFIELDGHTVLLTPKDPRTMRGKFTDLDSNFDAERAEDRY